MPVKLMSKDERENMRLDVDVPARDKRLVLLDSEGVEYHFGCGVWTSNGTFIHVATYTSEGRQPYAWWSDVLDGLERGLQVRDEPELGPRVSPLVDVALSFLAQICNLHNGFYGEPEKKWAVEYLRALWHEAEEPLDPDEVAVWAATHGWALKHAETLREIADGVRNGKRFMGVERAIQRDRERERAMVAGWREQLAEHP